MQGYNTSFGTPSQLKSWNGSQETGGFLSLGKAFAYLKNLLIQSNSPFCYYPGDRSLNWSNVVFRSVSVFWLYSKPTHKISWSHNPDHHMICTYASYQDTMRLSSLCTKKYLHSALFNCTISLFILGSIPKLSFTIVGFGEGKRRSWIMLSMDSFQSATLLAFAYCLLPSILSWKILPKTFYLCFPISRFPCILSITLWNITPLFSATIICLHLLYFIF